MPGTSKNNFIINILYRMPGTPEKNILSLTFCAKWLEPLKNILLTFCAKWLEPLKTLYHKYHYYVYSFYYFETLY